MYGEAPYGNFPVDLLQSPNEKDTYIVRYTPRGVGEHKIHINFAGEPVKGSPYIVKVRNNMPVSFPLPRSSPRKGNGVDKNVLRSSHLTKNTQAR